MEEPNHYIKYPMALYWKPVLENPAWPNAYISGPMFENFFHGRYNKVPILIGTTSEETLGKYKILYNCGIECRHFTFTTYELYSATA